MLNARTITTTLTCALLLACGPTTNATNATSESSGGCPPGAEGCPCPPSGACDDDLQCVDDACAPAPGSTTGGGSSDGSSGGSSGATTGAPDTTTSTTGDTATTQSCEFICDDTDPTCDAVPGLDGDPRCSPCDLFAQDCPDGEKCAPWDSSGNGAWDSTRCVQVIGGGQHGEPCTAEPGQTGVDDCDVGVMCWHLDEDGDGTCVELCGGSPDDPTCPESTYCSISGDGVLNLCLFMCDPLEQDCMEDEVCIPYPSSEGGFACVFDASEGVGVAGAPCEFANVCNAGLMCVNPDFFPGPECEGAIGCCAPFCDLSNGDADCQGLPVDGVSCVSYYGELENPPPQYENVGVCGLP